jgi:hypothetical protein
MNARPVKFITLVVILVLGCTTITNLTRSTPQPTIIAETTVPTTHPPQAGFQHFENEFLAFDYPKELKTFVGGGAEFLCYPDYQLGGELLVGLGDTKFVHFDKYYRSIRIFRLPMPSDVDLKAIMQAAYDQEKIKFPLDEGVLDATGPVTVAGYPAYQKTYRVYSGEPAYDLRDIWIEKDGDIILVSIWSQYTNPEEFAAFQAEADLFINSLKFKSGTITTNASPEELLPTEAGGSLPVPTQAVSTPTPAAETNTRPAMLYVSHIEGSLEIFGQRWFAAFLVT